MNDSTFDTPGRIVSITCGIGAVAIATLSVAAVVVMTEAGASAMVIFPTITAILGLAAVVSDGFWSRETNCRS